MAPECRKRCDVSLHTNHIPFLVDVPEGEFKATWVSVQTVVVELPGSLPDATRCNVPTRLSRVSHRL